MAQAKPPNHPAGPQAATAVLDRLRDPRTLAELFAVGNLTFLALDIYLAHSVNEFRHPAEWVPLAMSLLSAAVLWPTLAADLAGRPAAHRWAGAIVGLLAVGVGVAGMVFHLDSEFFETQTLERLVYAAPFAAPLAYAGLGLLLLLNRSPEAAGPDWPRWVLVLALGGFVGNFALSLADHAQNGFFDWREWIAVGSSAGAVGFLTSAIAFRPAGWFLRLCVLVLLAQVAVGTLGFYYHATAIYRAPAAALWDKVVYGAPAFAPLLFANLALLALLGLWATVGGGSGSNLNPRQGPAGRLLSPARRR